MAVPTDDYDEEQVAQEEVNPNELADEPEEVEKPLPTSEEIEDEQAGLVYHLEEEEEAE